MQQQQQPAEKAMQQWRLQQQAPLVELELEPPAGAGAGAGAAAATRCSRRWSWSWSRRRHQMNYSCYWAAMGRRAQMN
jgi:hypothetical protein